MNTNPRTWNSSGGHHGTHRHLLREVDLVPTTASTVDAIVVPTARPSINLTNAIYFAAELKCSVVALCSRQSAAIEVAQLAKRVGVELIAVDTDYLPDGLIPEFGTTRLLAGSQFERMTDTSLKRNLGLLIARVVGWQRIVFLDDDIEIPRPQDLNDAVQLLGPYAAAGLHIDGFPDNSVVCHAYRATGGAQETFIGGGALAVGFSSMTSFFPKIYNEDWFFLLDEDKMRPTGLTGSVKQRPYDPFVNAQRAASEELGDTLAEGIFSLLDTGRWINDADEKHWKGFLKNRRRLIRQVIRKIPALHKAPDEKARMIAALTAALKRCREITPKLCVQYLQAWRDDCASWRRHVIEMCDRDSVAPEKVIAELGLAACGTYVSAQVEAA